VQYVLDVAQEAEAHFGRAKKKKETGAIKATVRLINKFALPKRRFSGRKKMDETTTQIKRFGTRR
jgi:hypothetical protein